MTGKNLEIISRIVLWYENSFRIDWLLTSNVLPLKRHLVYLLTFQTVVDRDVTQCSGLISHNLYIHIRFVVKDLFNMNYLKACTYVK